MGKLQTGASPQNTKEPPLQQEHPLLQRTYNYYVLWTYRVSVSIVNWLKINKPVGIQRIFRFHPQKGLNDPESMVAIHAFQRRVDSVSNEFRSCGTGIWTATRCIPMEPRCTPSEGTAGSIGYEHWPKWSIYSQSKASTFWVIPKHWIARTAHQLLVETAIQLSNYTAPLHSIQLFLISNLFLWHFQDSVCIRGKSIGFLGPSRYSGWLQIQVSSLKTCTCTSSGHMSMCLWADAGHE